MSQQAERIPDLLVSVRNAEEVLAAFEGGADWIDLKEPNEGPLAAVSRATAERAVETLSGRCTLSAALGELRDWDHSNAHELLAVPGISLVKLGLAGCSRMPNWQQRWSEIAQTASDQGKQLVAVVYADCSHAAAPAPAEVLEFAKRSGAAYLLIDTFGKSEGSTFDYFFGAELTEYLHAAREASMTTVLAGRLTRDLIDSIPAALVDIVAVRGAVCQGNRTAIVDAKLVEAFRLALTVRFEKSESPPCPTG